MTHIYLVYQGDFMKISAIAAMAANRVIGTDGDLPWSIPEDMKFFKEKTMGHVILMGRKTYDSFKGRLLPRRLHVVITRQKDFHAPGAHVFSSVDDALNFCREACTTQNDKWGNEIFVIGGGEIYTALLPSTDCVYLTEIHQNFEGDARFPALPPGEFHETARQPHQGPVPFDFVTYERCKE